MRLFRLLNVYSTTSSRLWVILSNVDLADFAGHIRILLLFEVLFETGANSSPLIPKNNTSHVKPIIYRRIDRQSYSFCPFEFWASANLEERDQLADTQPILGDRGFLTILVTKRL